jgi:hypothetical protein
VKSYLDALLKILVRPQAVVEARLSALPVTTALHIPALAFCLLFLQSFFEIGRSPLAAILLGIVMGYGGITGVSAVGWLGLRLVGVSHGLATVTRCFALSYAPALLYCACGLAAQRLLGWPTAVAFGVTGLLWALAPMTAALEQLSGQRTWLSVGLSTVCGGLLLCGWALLMGAD